MRSPITTHVLDTARGVPAAGLPITLEKRSETDQWEVIARGTTNGDGRIADLLPETYELTRGFYRMVFNTGAYFRMLALDAFYPSVPVIFEIQEPAQHYHVPLLLSPYGYSTYRGS